MDDPNRGRPPESTGVALPRLSVVGAAAVVLVLVANLGDALSPTAQDTLETTDTPDTTDTRAPNNRTKGQVFGFMVKHQNTVQVGTSHQTVYPGDQLQFSFQLNHPRHVAVLSVDASQTVSVYFPAGPTTLRHTSTLSPLLPASVQLDGTLGRERIWGIHCQRQVPLTVLKDALSSTSVDVKDVTWVPEGCKASSLLITKRPAR